MYYHLTHKSYIKTERTLDVQYKSDQLHEKEILSGNVKKSKTRKAGCNEIEMEKHLDPGMWSGNQVIFGSRELGVEEKISRLHIPAWTR